MFALEMILDFFNLMEGVMDDIKQKISEYLKSHNYLNLATADKNGKPYASTVAYASDGAFIYFLTDRDTIKAVNISVNPSVAYTVDEDNEDWSVMRGIQATGKASFLSEKKDIDGALELLIEKFPQMSSMKPSPSMVIIKITLSEAYFLDNKVCFGHRDKVKFCRGK